MSCVLRASGPEFDVDSFLKDSTLKPLIVYRRGALRFPDSKLAPEEKSGMNVSVSVREFSDLPRQIEDAVRFLSDNAGELRRLRNFPGVDRIELDFPVEDRDVAVQSDMFPARLLSLMGDLCIGMTVSHYPPPSSAAQSG